MSVCPRGSRLFRNTSTSFKQCRSLAGRCRYCLSSVHLGLWTYSSMLRLYYWLMTGMRNVQEIRGTKTKNESTYTRVKVTCTWVEAVPLVWVNVMRYAMHDGSSKDTNTTARSVITWCEGASMQDEIKQSSRPPLVHRPSIVGLYQTVSTVYSRTLLLQADRPDQ